MIKSLLQSAFHALGYEVRRHHAPAPSLLHVFFQTWRGVGAAPAWVVDVGANHGAWTRCALNYFPQASYLLVEPQEGLKVHSADLLRRPGVRWLNAGVGDQIGLLKLTLPPRDDSATFAWSDAQGRGHPQIEVPVTTLDEIARQEGRIPDFVKIDAEGFDLKALRGASTLLGATEVFFVECAICQPHFENTLQAVCALMGEHGYRVFDITDLNRTARHGALWLSELVFVRASSPVWGRIQTYD